MSKSRSALHSNWSYPPPASFLPGSSSRGPRTLLASSIGKPPVETDYAYNYEKETGSSDDETVAAEQDLAEFDQVEAITREDRERLEWQTLLRSVLDGEVLSSEKNRLGLADRDSERPVDLHLDIWMGARAHLRCRSIEEEKKRVEHRRLRVGEALVEDVLAFRFDPQRGPIQEQINGLLRRLDAVESFYPYSKAMFEDKPALKDSNFQSRIEAMTSWLNVSGVIDHHYHLLQKWTGSESLDVIAPHTTLEQPIRPNPHRKASNGIDLGDASTFVERVLKEDSLVQIFTKRALVDIGFIVRRANENQAQYGQLYEEMGLPINSGRLRELLSFPTNLMQASLRVQLDYAGKVKDMDVLRIDQMMDDFKTSIREACKRKVEYEALTHGESVVEPCLHPEYDNVVLEAVTCFFGLLQRKLKSADGARGLGFKETDFLEDQWHLLDDVAAAFEAGSLLVAEQLCILLHRLTIRLTESFDQQVHNPEPEPFSTGLALARIRDASEAMAEEPHINIVACYDRLLQTVRSRYRKLRRFSRLVTNRFTNSAEYSMEQLNIDAFVSRLANTGHYLVLAPSYQATGTYIVAESKLVERRHLIADVLRSAFTVQHTTLTQWSDLNAIRDEDQVEVYEDEENHLPSYLLLFRPSQRFFWSGEFIAGLSLPEVEFDIKDFRMRLVADGGHSRLSKSKKRFYEYFAESEDQTRPTSPDGGGGDGDEYSGVYSLPEVGPIPCLVEQQAHLPAVNRELRKVVKATNRLAGAIVDSAHSVRKAVRGAEQYQELLENWYYFASEHAHLVNRYLDLATRLKFNGLLARLAISWVAFICDDCDATDRKTFRWAVHALEFARGRISNHVILHLDNAEFALLRKKVAMCMSLLIRHFDILGARGSYEAKREQERQEEIRRQQALEAKLQTEDDSYLRVMTSENEDSKVQTAGFVASAAMQSIRVYRDRLSEELEAVDSNRGILNEQERLIGKVLDDTKLEDRSLLLLASSHSNVSIRWQQGKFIGGGAFGSVYLASNMDTGGLMAVKEIRFQDVTGTLPHLYKSIKDELSVMEMLRHPNIVEYYGIEVHRDRVYIFEEYCQGGSLASLLEQGRIEDETIIQMYALQMLEGLNYLHSRGVVHRDIKPDNILLDHMGVIKYVDFGAAKIIARNRTINKTRAPTLGGMAGNSLTGTPMYMSPEVIKNDRPGRHGAMDIWSVGCVLLEAATGHRPWSNLDNEWAIMFHIGVATKHPPLPEPGQLSPLGIGFIRDCLNIDAMRRPLAGELLIHPWIMEIKQTLSEEEDLLDEQDYDDQATVAQHAANVHAEEVEILNLPTPLANDLTPTAEIRTLAFPESV